METTKTSGLMERIPFFLGALSVVTCTIIYISVPAGALAVMFALLARGGSMKLTNRAKLSIALGLIGMAVSIAISTYALIYALREYGSFQALIDAYAPYTGMTYDEMIRMLGL